MLLWKKQYNKKGKNNHNWETDPLKKDADDLLLEANLCFLETLYILSFIGIISNPQR